MTIDDRTLDGVTELVARHRTQEYRCTVERGEDGTPAFVLTDGRRFRSPSAAGSAVLGGTACNGWRFWSVAPVDGAEDDHPGSTHAARTKVLHRVPTQRAAASGETPAACPTGHSADPD